MMTSSFHRCWGAGIDGNESEGQPERVIRGHKHNSSFSPKSVILLVFFSVVEACKKSG